MDEMRELYQQMILDHYKQPRNSGEIAGANRHADGNNPLCGDKLHLTANVVDGKIDDDIKFQASGCAISTASASLMSEAVKGKSPEEAMKIGDVFRSVVMGETEPRDMGKLEVFVGVRDYPVRIKCAVLPWHTLRAALTKYRRRGHNRMMESSTPIEYMPLQGEVIEALRQVFDPEIPVNIYELGLIYDVTIKAPGDVHVLMTLTAPACPVAETLPPEVEEVIRNVPGVSSAKVEVVWEPAWDMSRMSDEAKLELGLF